MAYTFDKSSSQYLQGLISSFSYTTHTIAAWVRCADNTADNGAAVSVSSDSTATRYFSLYFYNDGLVYYQMEGATAYTGVTKAYSSNTWHSVIGTQTSATSREIYVDGAKGTTGTTNSGTLDLSSAKFSIGQNYYGNTTPADLFEGDVANVGVWNVVLTAAQREALDQGISPYLVAPNSLFQYAELIRPLNQPSNNRLITATNGPTVSTHPTIYKHTTGFVGQVPAVASGRVMGSLASQGGLAGMGGIAGLHGGIAG